jgi:hypothetical protein
MICCAFSAEDTSLTLKELRTVKSDENGTPTNDWTLDLDSMLPDSPFSSPCRTTDAIQSIGQPAETPLASAWHPSSLPSVYHMEHPWSAAYGTRRSLWGPSESAESEGSQMASACEGAGGSMVHSIMTAHGQSLSLGPVSHNLVNYPTGALCYTCRQQEVVLPSSQCTSCQQALHHRFNTSYSAGYEAAKGWPIAVTTYFDSSAQT